MSDLTENERAREWGLRVLEAYDRAEAERDAYRETLEWIAENAGAWHGVPHDCGSERALRVVGEQAAAVLAASASGVAEEDT
jgi:hypothetical protein